MGGMGAAIQHQRSTRSGAVVVRLEEAVIERGDFRLGPFTLDIGWADRVALVGPNGTGKTTLVEAILGRLPLRRHPAHGTERRRRRAGQDRRLLCATSGTLLDAFLAAVPGLRPIWPGPAGQVRPRPQGGDPPPAVALPGQAHARRAGRLCRQRRQPLGVGRAHEPPRPAAIEQLESALDEYGGTLVLVSHDRRLLEKCASPGRSPCRKPTTCPGLARGALSRSRADDRSVRSRLRCRWVSG